VKWELCQSNNPKPEADMQNGWADLGYVKIIQCENELRPDMSLIKY